ncbi:TetR family transcriptional regulator [Paenibacillus polymyxa]|uniref:acyl-CoA-like ligand-binding transcription factor n=1 Tax=Paenibacillus polymyxa TaxID=1406 RepID=UPI002AB5AD1D|nr:TetR family transcriptional regulator [Paenibacillus polymyxa]MDY8095804.1 TetR family transcriptional regulator [Paenibacillus polymyxa]
MSLEHQQNLGLRERKKAKTIASIQMHALRLFSELGYNETTVEQIAEAAEISPSTFFRYFSSKEDVIVTDNYDPLLISAFEEQPAHLTPLQAVRNAMLATMSDMSGDEMSTTRERNQLVMSVPELRAATLNNLTNTMHMIAEMVSKRVGRDPGDLQIRTFAGAVIGVNISVMLHYAENPTENFSELLSEALNLLETGLPL